MLPAMDEQAVRERAQACLDALLAGNVEEATEAFSESLRNNLGPIMAQLPLPLSEASVEWSRRRQTGRLGRSTQRLRPETVRLTQAGSTRKAGYAQRGNKEPR